MSVVYIVLSRTCFIIPSLDVLIGQAGQLLRACHLILCSLPTTMPYIPPPAIPNILIPSTLPPKRLLVLRSLLFLLRYTVPTRSFVIARTHCLLTRDTWEDGTFFLCLCSSPCCLHGTPLHLPCCLFYHHFVWYYRYGRYDVTVTTF